MDSKLRLALAFDEANSSRFDAILYIVISQLLYLDEYSAGLDKNGIRSAIKKELDLDFGVLEIEQAITKENSKKLFLDCSKTNKKFSLSEKGIKHFKKVNDGELDSCIDLFLEETKDSLPSGIKANKESVKNAIVGLLILVFNSNKDELLYLLKNKKPRNSGEIDKLQPDDRELAIAFFDWKNTDKDKLVFKMIAASYNYCVLSLKKDSVQLSNGLFVKKSFCLDTNVIYSAIGINGDENKRAVLSFINLCKQNKVKLCYFNYTKTEMVDTLHNIIGRFSKDVENGYFMDDQTFGKVFAKTKYEILYKLYKDWLKKPGDNKNYSGFEKHLQKEIDLFLCDLTPICVEEEEVWKNNELIEKFREELYRYKTSRTRRHVSSSNHDAICYYYMKEEYSHHPATITEQKLFFVTFDRLFYEWSISKAVGRMSTIVSVNVMYSLLLKISGRTDNDAKSFNEFLLMNVSNTYNDDSQYDIKSALVSTINEMERSDDSKKQIIVLASQMLEKDTSGIMSTSGTPLEKAGMLAKKAEETFDDLISAEHQKKIDEVKAEGQETAKNEFERGKEEGIEIGIKQEKENALNMQTKRISRRNYRLRIALLILVVAFTIAFFTIAIVSFVKEGTATVWGWIGAVSTLIGFTGIPVVLIKLIINKESTRFLPLNEEVIKVRLAKKQENK